MLYIFVVSEGNDAKFVFAQYNYAKFAHKCSYRSECAKFDTRRCSYRRHLRQICSQVLLQKVTMPNLFTGAHTERDHAQFPHRRSHKRQLCPISLHVFLQKAIMPNFLHRSTYRRPLCQICSQMVLQNAIIANLRAGASTEGGQVCQSSGFTVLTPF